MASSALKAHLHMSRKIVNDSHTFLLWDFPDLCCDCYLQFTNCLRIVLIHIILEIPPQIKIWEVQVWWTIFKQLVNWRQQSQQRSGKSLRRNVCEPLTILRDVCKCAFNAEDAIWSTFWKEHKNSMQTDSDG
jgi:hypothetical protein